MDPFLAQESHRCEMSKNSSQIIFLQLCAFENGLKAVIKTVTCSKKIKKEALQLGLRRG